MDTRTNVIDHPMNNVTIYGSDAQTPACRPNPDHDESPSDLMSHQVTCEVQHESLKCEKYGTSSLPSWGLPGILATEWLRERTEYVPQL